MSHASQRVRAEDLGAPTFLEEHRVRLAYIAGSMYKGIASKELVVRMAQAQLLGYLGTGGLSPERIEGDIVHIQERVPRGASYGMNLLCSPADPAFEDRCVDLFLQYGIERVEAAAFTQMTPALVRYRLKGLARGPDGTPVVRHRVLAKVSRPEVAEQFFSPAPERIVRHLLSTGAVSAEEAELGSAVPMSEDVCVESDSGGHTDQGVALALVPAIVLQRDRHTFPIRVRVGAAGGLGTPRSIAAAFVLGAEFVLTGSVNQCTVEAGMSDEVKDLLQQADVQDTAIAPAGDMFEQGAKVRVLRKGLFFPARANRLFDLYRQYDSLDDIDPKTREQIETRYFRRSFDEVWRETREYYLRVRPEEVERAERDPKHRMALVFKWYFVQSARLARKGALEQKVDFQVHSGPALGAFNQWVRGTRHENWRERHVDEIAVMLMEGAADVLSEMFDATSHGIERTTSV